MWTYRHSPSTWNTVCVCGVIFLYLCVYMCVRACGVISISVCIYMCVCARVWCHLCCICVCACAHTDYLRKCSVCMFVRTRVHMYVCVHVCILHFSTCTLEWIGIWMCLRLRQRLVSCYCYLRNCVMYMRESVRLSIVCVFFVRARKRERGRRERMNY